VDNGHRADEVLQNTRAIFSRQETRQTPLNVNRLIREVLVLTSGRIAEKNVKLTTNYAHNPLPIVNGNRVQLQQVLLNLIMNAVEAMDSSGTADRVLTLATEVDRSGHVLIIVRDSGPGIAADQLDSIFKSFFTTKPGGMGVGLSICKTIIEAHAGELKAIPGEPRGMVFTIRLPLYAKRQRTVSAAVGAK
jgi:signal transduction histidine kinase